MSKAPVPGITPDVAAALGAENGHAPLTPHIIGRAEREMSKGISLRRYRVIVFAAVASLAAGTIAWVSKRIGRHRETGDDHTSEESAGVGQESINEGAHTVDEDSQADHTSEVGAEAGQESAKEGAVKGWAFRWRQIKQRLGRKPRGFRVRDSEASDDGKSSRSQRIIGRTEWEILKEAGLWRDLMVVLAAGILVAVGGITLLFERTGRYGPKPYLNSLYYFEIPDTSGFAAGANDLPVECLGVSLTPVKCQPDASQACPLFRVCYVGTTAEKQLNDKWSERQREITSTLSIGEVTGLLKICEVGKQRLVGREVSIEGQPKADTPRLTWHVLMTEYEGRVYVIETLCQASGCGAADQGIRRMMDEIRFLPGVGVSDAG